MLVRLVEADGGEEGMLDLDMVAVFSVTPARSGVSFQKKKKNTLGEERTTTTKNAKAISWK